MEPVNERQPVQIKVCFFDEEDQPMVPTTFKYRIDDITKISAPVEIKTTTSASPGNTYYIITITSEENRILNAKKKYETRLLSCEWYSGSVLVGTEEVTYPVKNLFKIPMPAPTP